MSKTLYFLTSEILIYVVSKANCQYLSSFTLGRCAVTVSCQCPRYHNAPLVMITPDNLLEIKRGSQQGLKKKREEDISMYFITASKCSTVDIWSWGLQHRGGTIQTMQADKTPESFNYFPISHKIYKKVEHSLGSESEQTWNSFFLCFLFYFFCSVLTHT